MTRGRSCPDRRGICGRCTCAHPSRSAVDTADQADPPHHHVVALACGTLMKPARGACASRDRSLCSAAQRSGSQRSTGRSPNGFTRTSPRLYLDDPSTPYIILYPDQTRRWRATRTIRSRVDLLVCPAASTRLAQASDGRCEGDGGNHICKPATMAATRSHSCGVWGSICQTSQGRP